MFLAERSAPKIKHTKNSNAYTHYIAELWSDKILAKILKCKLFLPRKFSDLQYVIFQYLTNYDISNSTSGGHIKFFIFALQVACSAANFSSL